MRRDTWWRGVRPRSRPRLPPKWWNSTSRKATTSRQTRSSHGSTIPTFVPRWHRPQRRLTLPGPEEPQVNLANAQRDYDRQMSLLTGHFVSQSAVDNAKTTLDALRAQLGTQRRNVEVAERGVNMADRNLDDTVIRAPFSGVVTVKAAQPGEIVSPISAGGGFTRTGIGTILDMDSLR